MDIAEAEEFFKRFNGQSFHMCREALPEYEEFKKLNLSSDITEQWRQELLGDYFSRLFADVEDVWWIHSCIIDILKSTSTNLTENCKKLLDAMAKMTELNNRHKVIIIENMAGRTEPQEDGGVYLICRRTRLAKKMNKTMKLLIHSYSSDDIDMDERYYIAVESYKKAYRKFHFRGLI
ncbi:MAG: hypothetical protein K2L19_07785 [Eubacterium sp.]|nr:hypothetical protein [Eubacterium sp.]